MLAPEADVTRGVVIGSIFSTANPAPFDNADTAGIVFADDAQISYDAAAHALTAKLPGGSSVEIEADDICMRCNLHVTASWPPMQGHIPAGAPRPTRAAPPG